ncbi:hypothetical protein D3C81_1204930 [compost metagenome]
MDTGAVVGHQQKLGGAAFFADLQRHNVAGQLDLLAIEAFHHRGVRRLLAGGGRRFGGQGIAELRQVVQRRELRRDDRRAFRDEGGPVQFAGLGGPQWQRHCQKQDQQRLQGWPLRGQARSHRYSTRSDACGEPCGSGVAREEGGEVLDHCRLSEVDRQAIGQRLPIGAPGRYAAHQQRGAQDDSQQGPFVSARQGQRQVQTVVGLYVPLGQGNTRI